MTTDDEFPEVGKCVVAVTKMAQALTIFAQKWSPEERGRALLIMEGVADSLEDAGGHEADVAAYRTAAAALASLATRQTGLRLVRDDE